MFEKTMNIADYDADLWQAMEAERVRQEEHIELIASENYTSPRVMEAQGSQLTNKYAEGYPGKRYYGGCEHVDVVEQLAIDRAKELFGAEFANVQPHSGSQANGAVYMALCKPGDTILGMSLAHGGHLTHGASVSFSCRIYNAVQYGLNTDTGEIDYDQVDALAREHKPKMIVAGFSAYSLIVDWARFRAIADEVGAFLFVDMAHIAGLVAAGVYPSPMPFADVVTTTTTTTTSVTTTTTTTTTTSTTTATSTTTTVTSTTTTTTTTTTTDLLRPTFSEPPFPRAAKPEPKPFPTPQTFPPAQPFLPAQPGARLRGRRPLPWRAGSHRPTPCLPACRIGGRQGSPT